MARKKLKSATDQRRFTLVYNDFLESDILNYYEKMVFIILKKYADNETMRAFPSLSTIQRMTGISMSQVRRSINHMEELGVLAVEHRNDTTKGHQSNVYTLYDYAEMWSSDSSIDDVAAVAERISETKMIAELRARGYTVTKEKEPISEADQSKTDIDPNSCFIEQNDTINRGQRQDNSYSLAMIREHIAYDNMVFLHPEMQAEIDACVGIMQTVMESDKETLRVAGKNVPAQQVKDKIWRLDAELIVYAIQKYREAAGQAGEIKDATAYMLTILWNAENQYSLEIANKIHSV